MSPTNRCLIAVTGLAACSMIGCGDASVSDNSSPGPTPFDTAAANARAVSEAASLAAESKVRETTESPNSNGKAEEAVEQVVYQPPFPGRLDLFQPRKRSTRLSKKSSGDSADSVVLMGFATLDEPKVVLAIDGVVRPLSHGEEAGGVTVISIAPPRAVLQRGLTRWTASIE